MPGVEGPVHAPCEASGRRPRQQLEQIVGHEVDLFAYPYGLWNQAALPHVQAAGYRASCGCSVSWNAAR